MTTTQEPEVKTGQMIADRVKIIDTDCHITEPVDVWTSRLNSNKWGDRIPHVREHPETGGPVWFINGEPGGPVTSGAQAGWKEWPPSKPPSLEFTDPAAWNSTERLKRMDDYGIYAEILYPNVGGFGGQHFLKLKDPELMLEAVQAYNDFATEWCSVDPKRLYPVAMMPFWDPEASIKELERCVKNGYKSFLFPGSPDKAGLEPHGHPKYERLWSAAEEFGTPMNFHIGSAGLEELTSGYAGNGTQANYARGSCQIFLSNSKHVGEMITSGICHRHPNLNIVTVESGIGWLPFYIEALEWQWFNTGVHEEHPEYDLTPRGYFQRQIYGCFWFEQDSAYYAIEQLGPDNFFYETDFPHPTSMSPGPASIADKPRDFVEHFFPRLSEENQLKVLRDNAKRVYNLDID